MKSSRAPGDLAAYLTDESRLEGTAEEVVWPANPREAAAVLARAHAERTPVTVSGAGTGIVGGRVPCGGIVLALDRMTRIVSCETDPEGRGGTMRVEPGVTLAEVQERAAGCGLLYPPDPTEAGASIGGTIATNASGSRSFRYGPTRRWVERLLVGLAGGTLLDLSRGAVRARDGVFTVERPGAPPLVVQAPDWRQPATSKHAAGYYSAPEMDLVDLFIGSEGTLGVVLEADLRLVAAPETMLAGILFFADEPAAFAFVDAARDSGDRLVRPLSLEYFGQRALDLIRDDAGLPAAACTAILFEQDAPADTLEETTAAWIDLAAHCHASEASWLAEGPRDHRRFREFRHLVPVRINEILARRGVRKVSTDTAVPRGRLPELLARYRSLLDDERLEYVEFGHVGNDHVHVNVIPRDAGEMERAADVYGRLIEIAVALGGSISGEHGLGKTKARYLGRQYPPEAIERMRAIKRALDPHGVLGRGTIFADTGGPAGS